MSDTASLPEMPTALDQILESLKTLEHSELLKVIKAAAAEAEKRAKGGKISKSSKKEAGEKKAVPNQLKKNHAWIAFTLRHAIDNGWESFTVHQSKKNKLTGEKEEEEIEMPAAVQNDGGAWVYDGSITEKTPAGRQINHKEAMSLSKARKEAKHETWEEFDASYVPEEISETASETSEGSKVVRKLTAADKLAEQEAKKAAKEAEKEAKKAAKEAEKEAKKKEKEAETEAKKKEKEAEKSVKKAPKAPIAAGGAAAALAAKKAAVEPKPAAIPLKKKPAMPTEEWVPPAEGCVKTWNFKGKAYVRSSDNGVWVKTATGAGDWVGAYLPAEDRIDDSVEEPAYE